MEAHAYNLVTGEFTDRAAIYNDTWTDRMEALGLTVVQHEGLEGDREDYNYLGGVLTLKIAVSLIPDKAEIAADGEDQAVVAVQVGGQSPPASIDIEVDRVSSTVTLTDGVGSVPPITSPIEHAFEVRVSDPITYQDNGGCTVAASSQE